MKLSLKVEYACRVLAQLGKTYGSGQLAHIDELATAEEIPQNYLVQILNELRNGGLINSRRGKQGGYALASNPEDVTLRDIIAVMEPDMLESFVAVKGESGERVARIWAELNDEFCRQAGNYKLSQFLPRDTGNMYYI